MATIIGSNLIDETLIGTSKDDIISGNFLDPVFTWASPPEMFAASSNIIYGGAGDDQLYGMARDYTSFDLASPEEVGNELHGGSGDDYIAGWARSETYFISIDFIGEYVQTPVPPGGFNQLYGDAGDDFLAGLDGSALLILNDSQGSLSGILEPSSYLNGGSGNDTIMGHVGAWEWRLQGDSYMYDMRFDFDGSIIEGGSGKDIIYGDVEDHLITVADTSRMENFDTGFRGGVIDGGNGNDFIVGDVGTARTEVTSTAVDAFVNNRLLVGGDTITGGNGKDVIYGDIQTLDFNGGMMEIVALAGDIISGGNGKDTLIGQWGDDTLTGGNGKDLFVYDGSLDNGDDIIMDFSTKKDSLVLQNGATVADGGLDIDNNVVVNVTDAGVDSTITLVGVTNYADVDIVS